MRNSEAMVEQALRELGTDQAEMERYRTATENIFAPTGRFENVTSILGPPLASETVHHEQGEAADALTLTKLSYRLPVWPNLVFYFLGYPGVPVIVNTTSGSPDHPKLRRSRSRARKTCNRGTVSSAR